MIACGPAADVISTTSSRGMLTPQQPNDLTAFLPGGEEMRIAR